MLDYPEMTLLAEQMTKTLVGKQFAASSDPYTNISGGVIGSADLFMNGNYDTYMFIETNNGYGLRCGNGGKTLYFETPADATKKYSVRFDFTDGSGFTFLMSIGSTGVSVEKCYEWNKAKESLKTFDPMDALPQFRVFLAANDEYQSMPVKIFLTKHIAGITGQFAAVILLHTGIYPSTMIKKLGDDDIERLHTAMQKTIRDVISCGGKAGEVDLFGKKGTYPTLGRKAIGTPCPVCGAELAKNATGGVAAYCPNCQKKK